MAGLAQSLVVEGTGSRMDARNPGFDTRFGPEDLKAIPTRRSSMFDFIRATPGISPTSPGSGTTTTGTTTTASAFGSGTNENQFLLDGTNFTCPCNGVARSEPGVDFIQEIQKSSPSGRPLSTATSRVRSSTSYYAQFDRLTSLVFRVAIVARRDCAMPAINPRRGRPAGGRRRAEPPSPRPSNRTPAPDSKGLR
jgi:hypothetical protein